ncbi:MAG TPA: hypothetical protein VD931_03650 [Baekduia sp.]|nr:hypothetical protein [Baekduia sp.]
MSAFSRHRLPIAAFLAAALGGLGVGLAVAGGDPEVQQRAPRAALKPAVAVPVEAVELPATPALRLPKPQSSPAPVARGPLTAAPAVPERPAAEAPAQSKPAQPAQPAQPGRQTSPGPGLQVEEQVVETP